MEKNSKPLISIVMPIFIHKEWQLTAAIKSILNQTYENIEFIIVDGSSTSKNYDIIKRFNDSRIFYYKTKGYINCLNLGLAKSKGEYIARMDSDDISYRTRIEEQYEFLINNKDVDMCSVQAKLFGDVSHPNKVTKFQQNIEFIPFTKNHQIIHPAIMFRRSLNVKYMQLMPVEDCYLFRELLSSGIKIANLDKVLYSCRINSNSIMSRYPKYCQFRILQFNIYFLGKYVNENLIFHKDFLSKKSFCYEDLFDFIRYSQILSTKLKNEIDIYNLFYPYFKYMISHINDFSFKYIIMILFNPNIYPYELKPAKKILKFCFQISNKYINNKKIKILTILGIKIPLKFIKRYKCNINK